MREATSLLIHGVLGAPTLPDEIVRSVQGQPVVLLRVEEAGLWAAVSRLADPSRVQPPKVADALAYHRALQALHLRATILPLRYGTVARGAAEVRALLTAQKDEYRALLAQLAGCHEFGVRAQTEPPGTRPDGDAGGSTEAALRSGASYLRARREVYKAEESAERAADALIERLGTELGACSRAVYAQHRPSPAGRSSEPVLSMSFLVAREDEPAFRERFAALSQREPQRLQLLGPWPPYSFLSPAA